MTTPFVPVYAGHLHGTPIHLHRITRVECEENKSAERKKRKDVTKNDPRRVIRTLGITTPRAETAEGDTVAPYPARLPRAIGTSSEFSYRPADYSYPSEAYLAGVLNIIDEQLIDFSP